MQEKHQIVLKQILGIKIKMNGDRKMEHGIHDVEKHEAVPESDSLEREKESEKTEEKSQVFYGYARVSSRDQNEDRQMIALKEMGVPEANIFVDKQSGKDFERKHYQKMLKKLNGDAVLFIKSIDRLGRNYSELIEQWRIINKEKKADIVVIDMPLLDTRREKNLLGTFISDVVLALLSYVSENERMNIKQRQAEGIAAAKEKGVKFGRNPKPLPKNFHDVYQRWKMKKISLAEAAKECGMPRSSFHRRAELYAKTGIVD